MFRSRLRMDDRQNIWRAGAVGRRAWTCYKYLIKKNEKHCTFENKEVRPRGF